MRAERRADERTERYMTKLIDAFSNFVKAPKNEFKLRHCENLASGFLA